MSGIDGKVIKLIIFGESHGQAIGMTATGFPAGEKIDREALAAFMARRSAVGKDYATARKEPDIPVFVSGLFQDRILNSPLCVLIENTNRRSGDYDNLKEIPRPGHADFAAMMRYGDSVDLRGGGHFSGRLTAVSYTHLDVYKRQEYGLIAGDIADSIPFAIKKILE